MGVVEKCPYGIHHSRNTWETWTGVGGAVFVAYFDPTPRTIPLIPRQTCTSPVQTHHPECRFARTLPGPEEILCRG